MGPRFPLQISDFIQWKHNGILGLPQSKKLVRFSDDGQFGFVEGSSTGLPVSEIIPVEPPEQSSDQTPFSQLSANAAWKERTGGPK